MVASLPPGYVAFTPAQLDALREQDRAAGLLPKRGRPRKNVGPREPNGRASRRKVDNLGGSDCWSKQPDEFWTAMVLGTELIRFGFAPKPNPLFLNLARRCVLDIHAFKIAILWWSGFHPVNGTGLLRKALSIKATIGFEPEHERISRTNEGRKIARTKLGEDFVRRMDDAIFRDKIPDTASFLKDLIAVRDVWRSEEVRDSDRNIKEELCKFYRSEGLSFVPSKRGRRR